MVMIQGQMIILPNHFHWWLWCRRWTHWWDGFLRYRHRLCLPERLRCIWKRCRCIKGMNQLL
jgi:Transcriptional regulatory protein, C terminal